MFEKFGIKDALGALWQHKGKIVLGSIVLAALLTAVIRNIPDSSSPKVEIEMGNKNVLERVTVNFYLQSEATSTGGPTAETLCAMYLKAMESSECKLFVADYIVHGMGKAKVIEGVGGGVTEEEVTTNFFGQYVSYTLDATKTNINIISTSPSKEFSDELVNAYLGYVQKISDSENSRIKVVNLFRDEQQVEIVDGREKVEIPTERISMKILIAATLVISFLIMCIGTFVIALFRPTLNRRSDFENIGMNVIGEIVVDKEVLLDEGKQNS